MSTPSNSRPGRAGEVGVVFGSILLALALLGLVNWLGYRHWSRGDWTKAKIYSLSETTRKIVKGLKSPVDVTVFMTSRSQIYPQVKEILQRYKALSPNIRVEELDPERNLARAQQLVNEYQVKQNTVVFKSGPRKKYVPEDQIAEFDFSGMGGPGNLKTFKGESAFTSAILTVTSDKSPKVYFATGHGEKETEDASERGLSDLKDLLTKDNDTVAPWASLGKSDVPSDADLIVVPGPKTGWLSAESAALSKYLARGGHVLLMLDPVLPQAGGPDPQLGLGATLKDWGVRLDNDIVVDPGNALPFMGAETVYANHFGSHEIVDSLASAKLAAVFPLARSVAAGTSSHAGFAATVLVQTTSDGWGETDLVHLSDVKKDPADVQAPVSLAVAVSRGKDAKVSGADAEAGARLVVVGDSDFVNNSGLGSASNANLVLNAIHWVIGSENLVGIAPKTPEQTSMTLSASQLRQVSLLALVGIPGLAIVMGIGVWLRRRQ
jgi:ABC-type uncharacterized transport system involved in gliding motility auxiliary subunit